MVVLQGDVVWVQFHPARGSEPAGRHPAVVLQHDRFNRSAINSVIVVLITSKLRYGAFRGNVRLAKGEAALPKPSVVNVTQIATVDRSFIVSKLGHLTPQRMLQIWQGVRLVVEPDL